jgi:23S rRNA (pseudouridine1915-N3)-methyltransferase
VVGRDKNDPIVQAADEYVERIRRYFPIEVVEVKEEPLKKSMPVDRVKRAEAERIQKVLKDGEHFVLLDERGKELLSEEVAKRLDSWSQRSLGSIAFVVGGPSGLDPDFLRAASERWALSRMTLPHRIARLILAEQLYRACTILRGEPYHK